MTPGNTSAKNETISKRSRSLHAPKLSDAILAREGLRERTNAIRLIFGEADGLPGLIVDQMTNAWLLNSNRLVLKLIVS